MNLLAHFVVIGICRLIHYDVRAGWIAQSHALHESCELKIPAKADPTRCMSFQKMEKPRQFPKELPNGFQGHEVP